MKALGYFLSGAIVMGFWAIGLFFFSFWRDSRDRLFAYFCAAFWILALERVAVVYLGGQHETGPVVYLARVVAFALIAYGIVEKNRERERAGGGTDRRGKEARRQSVSGEDGR